MTASRSQWVLVAALCLLVAACGGTSPEDGAPGVDAGNRASEDRPLGVDAFNRSSEDRPPGVDADNWVRISDVAGVVLTDGAPMRVTGPRGERLALPTPRNVTGVLMVKRQGVWTRVELELPSPRVQPLL